MGLFSKLFGSAYYDYFVNAVTVWIESRGTYKETNVAALAVAKVAGKGLRKSMLDFLRAKISDLEKLSSESQLAVLQKQRLLKLYQEIASHEWTITDAAEIALRKIGGRPVSFFPHSFSFRFTYTKNVNGNSFKDPA